MDVEMKRKKVSENKMSFKKMFSVGGNVVWLQQLVAIIQNLGTAVLCVNYINSSCTRAVYITIHMDI